MTTNLNITITQGDAVKEMQTLRHHGSELNQGVALEHHNKKEEEKKGVIQQTETSDKISVTSDKGREKDTSHGKRLKGEKTAEEDQAEDSLGDHLVDIVI
ncbi:MAG: hypothetical protein V1753_01230 [Pseudomonadota bacterium]